MSEFVILSL